MPSWPTPRYTTSACFPASAPFTNPALPWTSAVRPLGCASQAPTTPRRRVGARLDRRHDRLVDGAGEPVGRAVVGDHEGQGEGRRTTPARRRRRPGSGPRAGHRRGRRWPWTRHRPASRRSARRRPRSPSRGRSGSAPGTTAPSRRRPSPKPTACSPASMRSTSGVIGRTTTFSSEGREKNPSNITADSPSSNSSVATPRNVTARPLSAAGTSNRSGYRSTSGRPSLRRTRSRYPPNY